MSQLLLNLGKKQFKKSEARKEEFAHFGPANKLLKDLRKTPHAYVLGCLMDRQVVAKRAWMIPYTIFGLIGSFSMEELKKRRLNSWQKLFRENSLHRHHSEMAKVFYLGVRDIDQKYGGDAAQIWRGKPSSKDVVRRFREFYGVGQKISTMAANILVRQFRVKMSDYRSIDISVDVHIERVMLRMGLVRANAKKRCAANTIIKKARELNSEFPGVFDFACWKIGKDFCHPTNPNCKKCPVTADCKKVKKFM